MVDELAQHPQAETQRTRALYDPARVKVLGRIADCHGLHRLETQQAHEYQRTKHRVGEAPHLPGSERAVAKRDDGLGVARRPFRKDHILAPSTAGHSSLGNGFFRLGARLRIQSVWPLTTTREVLAQLSLALST